MRELDPLAPVPFLGTLYAETGDEERAFGEWERSLAASPGHGDTLSQLGIHQCATGRRDEALVSFGQALAGHPDDTRVAAALAWCHAKSGDAAAARKLLADLERRSPTQYVDAAYVALVYVGLGELETAFEWFDRATAVRAVGLPLAATDVRSEPVRDDARFEQLLDRIGLSL